MTDQPPLLLLSKLAPAQTLYILKPQSTLSELLTFTLMDLILQERLQLTNFDLNPVQGEPQFGFARVVIGKKFQEEQAKLHEMVFLFPFYKKRTARILMKHLLQMGFKTSKSESNFKGRMLMDLEEMKPLFMKTRWQKIFGGQQLSPEGRQVQSELIKQFNLLDKELPILLKSDREKAALILENLKGNVILMNSFKFDLIRLIGEELKAVETELEEGTPDS